MEHQDLLSGLIRLHVLHHAVEGEVYGQRMIEELAHHGYRLSAGTLYPMLRGFVSPELMFFATSGNAVITVVIGGVGTLVGALYGSVILTVMKSVIGTMTEHHLIVIGMLFMAVVIFLPKGLMGVIRPAVARLLMRGAR